MSWNVIIPNPCSKKWADLEGDGRARFCATCKTQVHSIADYSHAEWKRLWRESNGHVCGFISGESPGPPRSRRAILVGALLTAVSPLFAASERVRFRIVDNLGNIVRGAEISQLDSNERQIRTLKTGESGEVVWTRLPSGAAFFSVKLPTGQSKRITLTIRDGNEVKAEVHISTPAVGVVVVSKRKHKGWRVY